MMEKAWSQAGRRCVRHSFLVGSAVLLASLPPSVGAQATTPIPLWRFVAGIRQGDVPFERSVVRMTPESVCTFFDTEVRYSSDESVTYTRTVSCENGLHTSVASCSVGPDGELRDSQNVYFVLGTESAPRRFGFGCVPAWQTRPDL